MPGGEHYGPASYFTLGWVYPRSRVRQPFVRSSLRQPVDLFVPPPPPILASGPVLCLALQISQPGATAAEFSQPFAEGVQLSHPGGNAMQVT